MLKFWNVCNSLYIAMFQNFYLIDAHLCGLLIIVTSRRLLYYIYKEVSTGFCMVKI